MSGLIKAIELPNLEFKSKNAMFEALAMHKEQIIKDKRVNKTKSAPFKAIAPSLKNGHNIKALPNMEDGYVYPVINTTLIMDSHNDVHANGIWDKSLKEAGRNVVYAQNHELSVGSIIGFQEDVTPFTAMVKWSELGYKFEGNTQALFFKVKPHYSAPAQAKAILEDKMNIQNSVRMEYVKMSLAIKSDDPELKEENDTFESNIDSIANKDYVNEMGYYWLQKEAKLTHEGSMVILGSNYATPIHYPTKDNDPSADSQKTEPSKDTQNDNGKDSFDIYTFI